MFASFYRVINWTFTHLGLLAQGLPWLSNLVCNDLHAGCRAPGSSPQCNPYITSKET